MKRWTLVVLATFAFFSPLYADRVPSGGVANAVFLATHSIQIDRDVAIVSGDVVVNDAALPPFLGEKALSLDRGVTTPAGYRIAADSIDIDQAAMAGGDVFYNVLINDGSIAGARVTPLALPVFATLPAVQIRPAGTANITVPDSGIVTIAEGAYGDLVIGRTATLRLDGGSYAFRSIAVARGGAIHALAASDVVVSGRADLGSDTVVGPEGATNTQLRIQVDGLNGSDGAMLSTPPAIRIGRGSAVSATLYATAGSVVMDQEVRGNGAFLGRDIRVGSGGRFTLNSVFNLPPVADPQGVFTIGTAPLTITLTGSDPEGGPLTFSIVSAPSAGTLSAPLQTSPTSANVTYTPSAANVTDSFTFRVADNAGATGDAIVSINPSPSDPTPPDPTTVVATDDSLQTAKDVPATVLLRGTAPAGVSLTFSIVANSGPSHGALGAITQGSESPERSATVVYTPDAGYVGPDAFQFQACGVIAGNTVCDAASFSITVQSALIDPPKLASDVEVAMMADTTFLISLGGSSIGGGGGGLLVAPRAAMLDPVTIAGNVADANGDGLGDNANDLPGSVPVYMSAGVNQTGGAGSNGTVRMQFEWDMSAAAGSASALTSASIILPTHRGTVDSLDTYFYWVGVSGDGNLTPSDFEMPAEKIAGAVMPVPQSMPIDGTGTFSFSVLDQVRAAASAGFKYFAIQGRVDESLAGPARGLEVRTSASGNLSTNNVPMLSLATPGITVPLVYRITSLPLSGVLLDGANPITEVPYVLSGSNVSYRPNSGFAGLDSFAFDASNGQTLSTALVKISVLFLNCSIDGKYCDNGR